jgi:WD40 repeat protein
VLALLSSTSGDGKSFVIVWDIISPAAPAHVLVADSDLTCACFSPSSSSVVLAGSAEGGILVWDLREASSARTIQAAADLGVACAVNFPAFSTHLSAARTQMHTSAIVAVAPIPTRVPRSREEPSAQFASVDDRGLVCFWVVNESTRGALFDDGEALRLVCSRTISVWGPADDPRGGSTSLHFDLERMTMDELLDALSPGPSVLGISFYPWDPNKFVVQGSDGRLLQRCRFGAAPSPLNFVSDAADAPSNVTSVHPSPFLPGLFLVGCADGSIRLYNAAYGTPLTTWQASRAERLDVNQGPFSDQTSVVRVQWSPRRPGVFFVLDSAPCLHAFDLLQDGALPIFSEPIALLEGETAGTSRHSFVIGHSPSCVAFAVVTCRGGPPQFIKMARALAVPRTNEREEMDTFLDGVL